MDPGAQGQRIIVSTWPHQAQHPAPMILHSSHLVGGPEFPHYLVDHHHTGKIRND